MHSYASQSNNSADSNYPGIATRLTSDLGEGTVSHIKFTARRLPPAPLRSRAQWVCWKYEQRGNNVTKPPVDPQTGDRAAVDDSSTWTDFETAWQYYQQADVNGVGFVLTENDPLAGIDWDDCRDPDTGAIDNWVRKEIKYVDSYTEVSPSGTGAHTILLGELSNREGNQNKEKGVEIYDSGRYFTVTGDHLSDFPVTIEGRDRQLAAIHEEYIKNTRHGSTSAISISDLDLEANEDQIALAQSSIEEFYLDSKTTNRAREYLTDLMHGRYRKRGFIADDGSADRSEAEYSFAGLLIGIFTYTGEGTRALELTSAYITHACRENRTTADGQLRKWLERYSGDYPRRTLREAFATFDFDIWSRWQRKGNNRRTWSDEYSDVTYEIVWEALCELSDDESRTYPERQEVINRAQEKDPSRQPRTHETALHRLRDKHCQVKMAYLGGNDYVYYPESYPDPVDAESVKQGGTTEET